MQFLVQIDTEALWSLSEGERSALIERERARGRELHAAGVLVKLWRLPGQKSNIGLWEAADADVLHEALASLPIWPFVGFQVTPLATHPLFT